MRRPVKVIDSRISVLQQRQGQEPVSDRRLRRHLGRGAHGIDVDPLVIPGRVGELVDARLRHLEPVADRNLLADPRAERANVDRDHEAQLAAFNPGPYA
jgi:hypothetical protein